MSLFVRPVGACEELKLSVVKCKHSVGAYLRIRLCFASIGVCQQQQHPTVDV